MSLLSIFNNLSTPVKIITVIICMGLVAMYILAITGLAYWTDSAIKEKNYTEYTKTQKNLMKMACILTIIMVIAVSFYGVYFLYNYDFTKLVDKLSSGSSIKSLASSILNETNTEMYDTKCDKLFSTEPGLNLQYTQMKTTRPIAEVRNLCGNYAKNILGRKV